MDTWLSLYTSTETSSYFLVYHSNLLSLIEKLLHSETLANVDFGIVLRNYYMSCVVYGLWTRVDISGVITQNPAWPKFVILSRDTRVVVDISCWFVKLCDRILYCWLTVEKLPKCLPIMWMELRCRGRFRRRRRNSLRIANGDEVVSPYRRWWTYVGRVLSPRNPLGVSIDFSNAVKYHYPADTQCNGSVIISSKWRRHVSRSFKVIMALLLHHVPAR